MTLDARLALIRESTIDRFDDSGLWVASDDSCIAVVRSRHAGVSALGYSRDRGAPVFVAIPPDDGGPKKVTIATCSAAYLDDPALKAALNAAELAAGGVPKWGGPAGMACSPQHEGTVLDDETIIAAVCAARRNK
ncbi:MAG TPA: hypothetical protein VFB99_23480 [Vicinamibacterales bacterium]|nr:hypothetical protein [Vicinamibacterales bacterium]